MITASERVATVRRAHNTPTVNCLFFSHLPVCVLNLLSDGEMVTDANPHLASCCELLELVLRKGLQRQYNMFHLENYSAIFVKLQCSLSMHCRDNMPVLKAFTPGVKNACFR